MQPGYRINTQPRVPAIEILTASIEDLRFWNWDQDGLPYWRLYWNDAAGASIHAGRQIDLGPDHLYLVAPHTPTRLRLLGRVGHLFVHFAVLPPFHQPRQAVWTFPLGTRQREHIHNLFHLIAQPGPPPHTSLQLLAIISHCLTLIPSADWTTHPMDRRIHHATLLIEQQLASPLSVDLLSQRVGMSNAAFARLFRATMGVSPYRYILRRRVEASAIALVTTDSTIERIAQTSGFCDRYHFTRVFTRHYGMGPAQFRTRRLSVTTT